MMPRAEVRNRAPEFIPLYEQGWSTKRIGEHLGAYRADINLVLRENGIQTRDGAEAAVAAGRVRYNTCIICGTTFRPLGNIQRRTCSLDCYREMRALAGGPLKHGRSQGHYQRIARRIKAMVCEDCGRTDGRLDVHHIDRNKANNTAENIVILCARCHTSRHYWQGDSGIRGAPRRRATA